MVPMLKQLSEKLISGSESHKSVREKRTEPVCRKQTGKGKKDFPQFR